jgi:hypothetical protein
MIYIQCQVWEDDPFETDVKKGEVMLLLDKTNKNWCNIKNQVNIHFFFYNNE